MQPLTDAQCRFFDAFGYLVLPGALREDIDWVLEEFEATFVDVKAEHDGGRRTAIVPFIDQRPKLTALLEHPVICGALASLLGPDFNYLGSDGNRYSGDTPWHSDGFHDVGRFLKVAMYLDPVRADSGALRVIPGTHTGDKDQARRSAWKSEEEWGIPMPAVPAVSLDSDPGDVVIFNHNLMHSSWGGSSARRMFTMNCSARARTQAEIDELQEYIRIHAMFGLERLHARTVREASPPERMVHLEQPMSLDGDLPELAAAARAKGDLTTIGWEATL